MHEEIALRYNFAVFSPARFSEFDVSAFSENIFRQAKI